MAVDYSSFDRFIATTNGQTIGAGECWDYVNLVWSHLGSRYYTYPPSNPQATNHGIKWGVLNNEARQANTINHLTFISDKTQLKRGDIVITVDGEFGHGGFMDEDWDGDRQYYIYSQNYAGRRSVARDRYRLTYFGGAFRYDAWYTPPPPPPPYLRKNKFKWVLYCKKLRDNMGF